MAHYFAIASVSATLQGLLLDARAPELGSPAVEIVEPAELDKERTAESGVAILLYRVAVSPLPRALTGRVPPGGRPKLPPLPVDLYYVLAPWGKSALVEHRLLGWLMRAIEDSNTLNSGQLNYYGGGAPVFAEGESVSLMPEPLSLQDLSNLWELLKGNPRLCVGYLARMVHLESVIEPPTGAPVQARDFDLARVTA